MPDIVNELEDDQEVIEISTTRAKREGWLPWEQWYDEHEYFEWKKTVRHYFQPLDRGNAFFVGHVPNVTELSAEKYDYFIGGGKAGYKHKGHSHVIVMGSLHRNETMWVGHQMQIAIDNFTLFDKETNGNRTLHFNWIEPRYDEPLALGFNIRFWPSVYFIDDETNGTVYQWDSWEYLNNETFASWILNKEYLNSSIQFPVPRIAHPNEYYLLYSIKWLRTNFGGRFCKLVKKVPFLEKNCFFMICDWDKKDMLRKKEDRFTMVAAPLFFIFIAIPWTWWGLKHVFSVITWCCAWNVYVEEDVKEE